MSATGAHKFQATVNLLNDTTVDVASDSQLVFDGALDLGATTLTKTGAGELAIRNDLITAGGGTIILQEGIVAGNGTISGDVNNMSGTLSPGNSPAASAAAGQVPEPSTWLMLAVGLIGVAAWWASRKGL